MKRMRFKAALLPAALCILALVLSGCGAVKGFERDLSVVAVNDDGTLVSIGTVNIFNNWILPDTAVSAENPEHYFLGWSVDPVYQGEESARLIYNAKSVVRYNDVAQYADGNNVTLYAIYGEQPRQTAELHYLVVGWYAKTSTTGLDETIMEGFTSALMDYLRTQGATEAELADVVIQAYDGNVATIGEAINADGNVDILIGVGSNIDSTGNVKVLEKHGGSFVGEISRYTARLTDSELVRNVYAWVMETYGAVTEEPADPTPVTPSQPSEPVERTHYLVLGWYAKTETTGLDQAAVDAFLSAMKDYLKTAGASDAELSDIVVKAYDGSVAEIGEAINADGNVDILLGVGNNISSTGGVEVIEKDGDVTIGATARYIARLTEDETVQSVYSWIRTTYGPGT